MSDGDAIRDVISYHERVAAMFERVLPFSLNKEWVQGTIAKHKFYAWVLSLALPTA